MNDLASLRVRRTGPPLMATGRVSFADHPDIWRRIMALGEREKIIPEYPTPLGPLGQAFFAAVLNNSGTLPKHYGLTRTMRTSRLVGGHRDQQVLNACDLVHDRVAVAVPTVNAETECG